MPDVLAESLSEKAVMGTDGAEIGSLYNLTVDLESGQLEDLVVAPLEDGPDFEFSFDEDGHYLVPVGRVQSVRDYIVVDR
jgi:sporulation protein YlmC with PRC-barrel domain